MTDLVSASQVAALEPLLDTLLDVADAYDMGSLSYTPRCPIHSAEPRSNSECTCLGTRYTAVEFVQALAADVRAAGIRSNGPAGQPNRRRDGHLRVSLLPTG